MTEFYPIVFTRTALPLLSKGRNGFDFLLRVGPKALPPQLYRALTLLINEDHYPKLKTPRRLFLATEEYIFWGLGLYNEWFLPHETKDALDLSAGERLIRGFWGGLLPFNGLDWSARSKALRLIASALVQNPRSCVATLDNGYDVIKPLQDGVEYDFSACRGTSEFPFAARLFQVFVERHWTVTMEPRPIGATVSRGVPTLWQASCDLERFAEELPDADRSTNEQNVPNLDALALALSRQEVAQVNRFWIQLALNAQRETCGIAPLGSERQADVFLDFMPPFTTVLARPETPATYETYQPRAIKKAQADCVTPRSHAAGDSRQAPNAHRTSSLLSSRYDANARERGQVEQKKSCLFSRLSRPKSTQEDDVQETGGFFNAILDLGRSVLWGPCRTTPERMKLDRVEDSEYDRSKQHKSQSQKDTGKKDVKKNDAKRDESKRARDNFFN